MRALFLSWNALNDPGSGAARSFRTRAQWLAEAGHDVVALCAAGFEGLSSVDLAGHLGGLGVSSPGRYLPGSRNLVRYDWEGLDVNFVCTKTSKGSNPDPADVSAFTAHVHRVIREHRPQLTNAYGAHRAVHEALRLTRKGGSRNNMDLYNFGYENRKLFEFVDRVAADSGFLAKWYEERIGLRSFVIRGPIEPEEVLVAEKPRDAVVFVNPTARKGSSLVAAIAERLHRERPDIPLLVVCSDGRRESFEEKLASETAAWVQFAGPFAQPKGYLGRARFLLAPSLVEALGRVCIEALMNGIPSIGTEFGGIPEAMAGTGVTLTLPQRLAENPDAVVPPEEAEEWFRAILHWWDNPSELELHEAKCRAVAEEFWTKEAQHARVLGYYEAIAVGR